MEKRFILFVGLIFLITSSFLVSAQSSPFFGVDLRQGAEQFVGLVKDFVTPFFEVILGDYSSSEFFFTKVLFVLLLFFVINVLLARLPLFQDKRFVAVIIAIIVSIIAIRFISENEMTRGLLLPYGTLGAALLVALPFIIWFVGVQLLGVGPMGRRLLWGLFGIIFVGIWLSLRSSGIDSLTDTVYKAVFVLIIAALIFDKAIHRYFAAWELSPFYRGANQRAIAALQAEYLNIINVQSPQASARRRAIERQLRSIGGSIP